MNLDNQRLREIHRFKQGYQKLMDEATTITDILGYHEKIKELETEEKEILKRCDVVI